MGGKTLPLPVRGRDRADLLDEMRALRDHDIQWEAGKAFSLVYHAGDEISDFTKEAYTLFFSENGLNPTAFPSLRRFETEVVAMTSHLLGGDAQVCGNMTSGGTESILMAVKTAREWARKRHPRLSQPEMVLPVSAHPAFQKAAHYFGVKPVLVPVRSDFRANMKATRKAINRRTILLVGSAPSYPQGIVDPIAELGRLAEANHLLFHVDACIGGFMLPFVRSLGYPVPEFDFQVPGVTSMSVDLHKYAYAAKGASVVLFRNAQLRRHMFFAYTDWPGGIYVSPTMGGTRPGGAIAAAWAVMHKLGQEGYREIAREVMSTTTRLREGIQRIDGVHVLGNPHMSILAIGSDEVGIYEVGDEMSARGWHIDRQQFPSCLHLTVNRAHVGKSDAFLADLRVSVERCKKRPVDRALDKGKYALANAAVRVLPGRVVSKLTSAASTMMGVEDVGTGERSAAMYGLMANLPNRGDLQEVVLDALDRLTRL